MPKLPKPEHIIDKKIIYRALSVQYTILSALMYRVPCHPKMENIGDYLTSDTYTNLRPTTCKYLEWIMQLMGYFSLLADEQCVKVFNYFWRESHDEVCFSSPIQNTNEKISPYFYAQFHRKKELLRGAYLIVN